MESKICTKCKYEKSIYLFGKDRNRKDGLYPHCNECRKVFRANNKEYEKQYRKQNIEVIKKKQKINYEKNKEKRKKYDKIRYEINKEKIIAQKKEYQKNNPDIIKTKKKKHRQENKEKIRIYEKEYRKNRFLNNPTAKLSHDIGCLIRISIRNNGFNKTSKTQNILGCSFEDFKSYLESKFEPWMNWNNRGKYNGDLNYGWDMDHIIPISSAKTNEDVIRLNHYTNFQPLCSKINRDVKKNNL